MIYDFRILPFALGDIIISMIHNAIDLNGQISKFPHYYFRNDLVKVHPIQSFINKRNVKKQLGDLSEALLFNPLQLPVRKIGSKPDNAGCETAQDLEIFTFYKKYLKSNRVENYHSYFNTQIASHRSLNQLTQENKPIPNLQTPRHIAQATKRLIKKYTGKNKWICVHLRFRGIENTADLADINRNADPGFWYGILSNIAQEYKNDEAVLLLGPKGSYPESFYKIPNLHSVSAMGGTLKNSIAAILSASAFIGSSSGFANCATFSNTPYLIFDLSENGYGNYCIDKNSIRLPFAKEQQYLSSQSDSRVLIKEKVRTILPNSKFKVSPLPKKAVLDTARAYKKTNSSFSHIVSKLLRNLNIKPNKELFSEICLLEKAVPELKEDAILKWVKSKSLVGFYEEQARDEECINIIKELKQKSGDAIIGQILQNPQIKIEDAISVYHKNWPTFARDIDSRAIRNLLGKLYFLGLKTVGREIFIILFFFWKCWYRLFYKPFARFRF